MTSLKEFFKGPFTVTPSDVLRVIDPSGQQYSHSRLSQEQLNQLATRGNQAHKRTGLELTHSQSMLDNLPQQINQYIHDKYPGVASNEKIRTIRLGGNDNNIYLRAKTDNLFGRPPQCLCVENKPGDTKNHMVVFKTSIYSKFHLMP